MELTIYQIDAFAEKPFEGNPAAVVPLESWLPDSTLQAIAEENNLAETAFFVPNGDIFNLRWFTPVSEVKLCGHATLAAAFVLFQCMGVRRNTLYFDTLSGSLSVLRQDSRFTLDFPAEAPTPCATPEALTLGLGTTPDTCLEHADYLAVFPSQAEVAALSPDFSQLAKLGLRGVIATAPGDEQDFVARFFAPKYGIPEDPVTGSAFTQLTPYWAERTGKTRFEARQISARGGNLQCQLREHRVLMSGSAVLYMEGTISI